MPLNTWAWNRNTELLNKNCSKLFFISIPCSLYKVKTTTNATLISQVVNNGLDKNKSTLNKMLWSVRYQTTLENNFTVFGNDFVLILFYKRWERNRHTLIGHYLARQYKLYIFLSTTNESLHWVHWKYS